MENNCNKVTKFDDLPYAVSGLIEKQSCNF
ncbi:hypothetical protein ACSSVW_000965 [Pseudoalteromonas sp. MBR-15]|jgi:hypothetical protein